MGIISPFNPGATIRTTTKCDAAGARRALIEGRAQVRKGSLELFQDPSMRQWPSGASTEAWACPVVVLGTRPPSLPAKHVDVRPAKAHQPDGPRTGSPPSPPPRLIRPNVRLLPWSPRLWVRVPVEQRQSAGSVEDICTIFRNSLRNSG